MKNNKNLQYYDHDCDGEHCECYDEGLRCCYCKEYKPKEKPNGELHGDD